MRAGLRSEEADEAAVLRLLRGAVTMCPVEFVRAVKAAAREDDGVAVCSNQGQTSRVE